MKNICVIGTSYIGAMVKHYSVDPTAIDRYKFDFYGHSNGGFPQADIVGGMIVNMRFRSAPKAKSVDAYDAFVVYADLPSPHDVLQQRRTLSKSSYSNKLGLAVVSDSISKCHSIYLANKLKCATRREVFLISSNILSIIKIKADKNSYDKSSAIISRSIGEFNYIPFPYIIFDEEFIPKHEYYKGSVKLTGEKAGEDDPGHDYHHMNERGGAVMMEAVVKALDSRLL